MAGQNPSLTRERSSRCGQLDQQVGAPLAELVYRSASPLAITMPQGTSSKWQIFIPKSVNWLPRIGTILNTTQD